MSVDFTQPPSSASVPDASEIVKGKIRIATSAEATAGTDDLTAMTPLKVQSVVNTALVGGVTYQGTFDASSPADLSNASKGDLYIISVAGTYQGQSWAVGDHLLINADMGGTLDSAKIDKVDNTDAVTSVAGRTGAVTLSTADISGLATVASTGAYSDLSGTPTLATVATTGAYSDLSGTPTLGTAAALDVGTSANNVVQLDGTGKLPAVDGSQLTNLPSSSLALDDLTDVTITGAATGEVLRYNGAEWVDAQLAYSDLSGAPTNVSTFTNDAGYISDITAENLGDLANVDLTGLADGEIIIYNATSGKWEANPPPAPLATTTSVGLIEIAENAEATAGTATDKALVPSNISSITTAQLDNSAGTMLESANNLSELTNAATARTNLGLATVASTGAYSDLSGTPTLGTAAALDVGTSANNVVQLNGSAQLPAVDGSLLTGVVADISGASIGDLSDVTITGAATGEVLRYNGTAWVDAQLAYTDVSGLGTAAALDVGTSANNVVQLNGSAQLPAVDGSLLTGVVADLSGATLDGLSDVSYPSAPTANQLLQWNSTNSKWEPVDSTTLTSNSPGSTYSITTHKGIEEVYLLTPSVNCTVSIPTASTVGAGFKYNIKNLSTNTITINATIDGASSLDISTQYSSITIVSDGTNWYVI